LPVSPSEEPRFVLTFESSVDRDRSHAGVEAIEGNRKVGVHAVNLGHHLVGQAGSGVHRNRDGDPVGPGDVGVVKCFERNVERPDLVSGGAESSGR
jgi:hypothetical protein